MASPAPITGAQTGAPAFVINGTTPFAFPCAGEYVRAAHAVAVLGSLATGDEDGPPVTELITGIFDAIGTLLAHADQLAAQEASR